MGEEEIIYSNGKYTVGITKDGKYFEGFGANYCNRNILNGAGLYIQELLKYNTKLEQQNKQMREALEFYANSKHLIFSDEAEYNEFFSLHNDKRYHYLGAEDFSMFYEGGMIAQQALNQIEKR